MRQQENQQRNKRRTVDLSAAAEYLPWPVIEVRAYDEALTRIGATATDPRPAYAGLQSTMREVCALGAFAVGHVYLSIPRRGHLVPAHLWRFSYSARFGPFVRVTMATILAPGVGLPGQAHTGRQNGGHGDPDERAEPSRIAESPQMRRDKVPPPGNREVDVPHREGPQRAHLPHRRLQAGIGGPWVRRGGPDPGQCLVVRPNLDDRPGQVFGRGGQVDGPALVPLLVLLLTHATPLGQASTPGVRCCTKSNRV